jgi:hypothetical protein
MKQRLFGMTGALVLAVALCWVVAGCDTDSVSDSGDTNEQQQDDDNGGGGGSTDPYITVKNGMEEMGFDIKKIKVWNVTTYKYDITHNVTLRPYYSETYYLTAGNTYQVELDFLGDTYRSNDFSLSTGKYRNVMFSDGNYVRVTGEFPQ